jgi:hypothetical protein
MLSPMVLAQIWAVPSEEEVLKGMRATIQHGADKFTIIEELVRPGS